MPWKARAVQVVSLVISGVVVGAGISMIALGESNSRPIAGWSEQEFVRRVDQRIEQRLSQAGLTEDQLDARIDQGILAFIAKRQARQNVKSIQSDDHVLGERTARITLIEYSDYSCRYCRRFHATAHRIVEDYRGRVNWVFRHFPLTIHNPDAQRAAVAAECAAEVSGNRAFWAYGDRVFRHASETGGDFSTQALVSMAVEVGVEGVQFKSCLDSARTLPAVRADVSAGEQAGITGTPANFVQDNVTGAVVSMMGARPYEQIARVIDQLLAQAPQAPQAGRR